MTERRPFVQRLLPESHAARVMALGTLINVIGNGMYVVVAVLYFTRIVGLSPTEVGVGLSIAGLFGLLSGVPMGHLGDRVGGRELIIVLLLVGAVAAAAAAFVDTFWQFVVQASVLAIFDRGSAAVRNGLMASTSRGPERVHTRAYLRAITNVGLAIGAGGSALALIYDTRTAYTVVIAVNAATYLLTAWVFRSYPHIDPIPREQGAPITQVFRDTPYLLMTALMAAMAVQYAILDVGVPLWVDNYTSAPRWTVSLVFVINTVVVILFQLAVSRRVVAVTVAARVISISGIIFWLSCLLFAMAEDRPAEWAVILLVTAALVHTFGELLQAAAQFCLGQELAAEHAQGQYQGLASTGFSLSAMIAPTVITLLPIELGMLGWWILGGIFVALGAALPPVVKWTQRTRAQFAAPPVAD
jgi:MFS family permease